MNRAQSHNLYVMIALLILGTLWFFISGFETSRRSQPQAASNLPLSQNEGVTISCSSVVSQALIAIAYDRTLHPAPFNPEIIATINECAETECSNLLYSGSNIVRDAFATCLARARLSCGYDIALPNERIACVGDIFCAIITTSFGDICATKTPTIATTSNLQRQAHVVRIDIMEINGLIQLIRSRLHDIAVAMNRVFQ